MTRGEGCHSLDQGRVGGGGRVGWGTPRLSTLDSGSSNDGTGQGILGNWCILKFQDPYPAERVKARQDSRSVTLSPGTLSLTLGSERLSVTASLCPCPH